MAITNSNPYISKIKVPGNNTAINIEIPVSQLRDVDDGVTTERINLLKDLKTTSTVQAQIDGLNNTITSTYETKTGAETKLNTAKGYTDTAIANLVDSAPGTLNTLNELAAALKNNPNVVQVLEDSIDRKLDKTTYEYNKELALGSTGKVCIGKFPMYDSNISVEIKSTTNTTYNGTLVIATQNINTTGGGTYTATVYGDASNTLTGSIKIQYLSGSNVFSVYINLPGWSKNLLHIQCVALKSAPTDIATTVSEIPSTATIVPTNALKAQLDGKAATSHTHTVANITDLTATAAELNYMDGVTNNVQTQLNGKQATLTGGATTIASSNLTASRALVSNSSGKVAVSAVTSTELGYLDGVTSAIQTQLDGKASLTQLDGKASSTHTHTVSHTPAGTVSKPTFTGSAVNSGKPDTTNVTTIYSMTGVGSLPSLTAAIANKCMTVIFGAGSLPTRSSAISMPNINHTHSVTASGSVSQPTFTGTAATLTTSQPK